MLTRSRTRQLINLGKQTIASLPVGYLGEQVGKEIAKRAVNSTLDMVKKITSKRRGSGVPVNRAATLVHRRRTMKRGVKKRKKPSKSFMPQKKKTKFARKVVKVLADEQPTAYISRTCYQQLRQTTLDRVKYYDTDAQNNQIAFATPTEVLHNASICWNGKALSNDITSGALNLDSESVITVMKQNVSMFFKSTSNHVVNIEIFECTAKNNQNDSAQTDAGQSINDLRYNALTADGLTPNGVEVFGYSSTMMIELHRNWTVKVHRIKMLPGESTSKVFKISGMRTYKLGNFKNNDSFWTYPKGSKSFFFRVINEPTVSGGGTGHIHHWPSNTNGGVALRVHMTSILRKPENVSTLSSATPGAFVFDATFATSSSTDQQVAYQNPITTATNI